MFGRFLLFGDHPYQNLSFFDFFIVFFQRLFHFFTGSLSFEQIASDEIQVFVLSGIAISSAIVGTFLVLQRMTMLANSLSHTILIGIVLAFLFYPRAIGDATLTVPMEILLIASFITGIFTTFLTQFITKAGRLQEDASTGLVFTTLFALGVVLVTLLTRSAHIGTEAVMGDVDALHRNDLFWVYLTVGFNFFLCLLFFKELKLVAFDSAFAKALGFSPLFFNYLLMTQVSVTTITSFRAVGILLVLAFMTAPVLTARLFTDSLSKLIALSSLIGAFSAFIAVALTRYLLSAYGLALSTSGVVVCVMVIGYFLSIGFILIKRRRQQLIKFD